MNKYKVIYQDTDSKIISERFDSIVDAMEFYKEVCQDSVLLSCTILLMRNNDVINKAKFTDLEDDSDDK